MEARVDMLLMHTILTLVACKFHSHCKYINNIAEEVLRAFAGQKACWKAAIEHLVKQL